MYAPPVRLEEIRTVKRALSIQVIGNGDVADGPSTRKQLHALAEQVVAEQAQV